MAESTDKTEEIPIEYEYDPDYRVIAVNGIYGGLTPRGGLKIDFFIEYTRVPDPGEVVYKLAPDGSHEELRKSGERKLVRRLQIGMLVPTQQIESFAVWLQTKAQEVKSLQDK